MGSKLHRAGAIVLSLFIVSHLIVHLSAYWGIAAHLSALDAVQWIYRNPLGEALLVVIILSQIFTGARRLRFKGQTGWARIQVLSGAYLLMFLFVHTSAAVYTHHIYGLETDFYWAAGSMHFDPIRWGFAVYYILAILAFFSHIAAAIHFNWSGAPTWLTRGLPVFGFMIGSAIVYVFWGNLYPIELSPEVEQYYGKYLQRAL